MEDTPSTAAARVQKCASQTGSCTRPPPNVEAKRDDICSVVRRHRGRSVSVFGSARRDETAASDIDFLLGFEPGSSLFDLLHISEELEQLLGVPVDVISPPVV